MTSSYKVGRQEILPLGDEKGNNGVNNNTFTNKNNGETKQ